MTNMILHFERRRFSVHIQTCIHSDMFIIQTHVYQISRFRVTSVDILHRELRPVCGNHAYSVGNHRLDAMGPRGGLVRH